MVSDSISKEETRTKDDIVDALEARGDSLSLRAARYIRIKRRTLESTERVYRSLCEKTLADGSLS